MKRKKKRPKGAPTPSGPKNKQTSKDIITLRLLFYNLDGNLFAEASLIFKSIYDFATQKLLTDELIKHFLELYGITEDQLEVCIHV